MKYLLDTYAFLWWLFDDPKLSSAARGIIRNPENMISVSSASAWEIATKYRQGKLPEAGEVATDIVGWVKKASFDLLPITTEQVHLAGSWQVDRRNLFDRMLAAQTKLESHVLVTVDKAFALFTIETIW
ncbi:type II toxin-antitoxin system VapC family toxin [Thiolapillus sp.]|uniref:type II toxin-antitoxin system VapC family toxin n=1 Tax=Thiolapillus sp. TaxID=2017437 RepID=UPI003AF42777